MDITDKHTSPPQHSTPLFSDQGSSTIPNSVIQRKDDELSILLSLSNEIATVRTKNDLLQVLNIKLKELFPISGFGITLLNEDGQTHSPFIVDSDDHIRNDIDFKKVTGLKYSVEDGVYNVIVNKQEPVLLTIDKVVPMVETAAYVAFWKKLNVKLIIGNALAVAGRKIGCLILLPENDSVENINDELMKGVCAALSVSVSNIKSNEEIIRREEEKTLLLAFSNEVAGLRTRNDFFAVINSQLKKIFSLERFGIANINADRKTHNAFMIDLGDSVKGDEEFEYIMTSKYDIHDPVFSHVMTSDEPVLLDVDRLAMDSSLPAYVGFWKKVGFKYLLCIQLRVGGNDVGVIFFDIDDPNEIKNLKTNLLKGVGAQIAVAVSNILSNEDIIRREKERTLLLSLNMDMSAVRKNDELMQVIAKKLKTLLNFSHSHLCPINDDNITITPFLYDPHSRSKAHPKYQELKGGKFTINDGIMDKSICTPFPVLTDLEELKKEQQLPLYCVINLESGIRQLVTIRLTKGDEPFGFWMIFFDKKIILDAAKSSLIKGIAEGMSIALSNIIANQNIEFREEEKSMLLEFSNSIASLREKYTLAKVLSQQLKDLFGIEDYAIHALSEDKKTHRPILYDPDAEFAKTPIFQQMIAQPSDVNDGVFNTILNATEVVTFSINDWVLSPKPPTYTDAAVSLGIIKLTGVAIRRGDETIAVMNFKHDESNRFKINRQLFKSICSQLAIAVSNLIANEKIENQLHEINKYKQQLEEEKIYLKEEIATTLNYDEIVGESPEIQKTFHLIKQVAPSDSTVLLQGETGTGKELVARAIHNSSSRKNKLMVKLNCAALPANLIESELFGHERGSFTGAMERRIGKFELANNGTLFLDEIGEMPLELQVKLLRALQEQEIERVGGKTTIKVDVRIIAATNRDLEKEMEEGRFRSDLYYRLNIFPINLPPLRNRKEDIPMLASNFIARFAKKSGKQISGLSKKALQELIQYNWPGNIRELEHLIERSVLLTTGDTIKEIYLPSVKQSKYNLLSQEVGTVKTIDENEKEYILKTLKHVKGRISGDGGAAELLGVPPSTLNSKMKRLGISRRFTT